MELSVLIPAYNEGRRLEHACVQAHGYLTKHGYDFEFVIVDDASTDDTAEIARGLESKYEGRIRLLRHPVNQGPCSGLRTGPKVARGQWILLLPVDLAVPLEDIGKLWAERHGADVVLGYVANLRTRGWARRVQSTIYTHFINALFGLQLNQVNYVALYRRTIFDTMPLITSGVALHAEILIRAHQAGHRIRQVAVGYQPRTGGVASGSNPRVILKTFREILKLRRNL